MSQRVIVVWCDSASGLVSTRVDSNNHFIQFTMDQLPDIEVLTDPDKVFDILLRKDGTKIAIPTTHVSDILGWDINGGSNSDTPESATSESVSA